MCGMSLTMLDRKPEINMLVEFRPMDYSSELNDMQYVILQKKKKRPLTSFYGMSSNSGLQQISDFLTSRCLVRRMQMNKGKKQINEEANKENKQSNKETKVTKEAK